MNNEDWKIADCLLHKELWNRGTMNTHDDIFLEQEIIDFNPRRTMQKVVTRKIKTFPIFLSIILNRTFTRPWIRYEQGEATKDNSEEEIMENMGGPDLFFDYMCIFVWDKEDDKKE